MRSPEQVKSHRLPDSPMSFIGLSVEKWLEVNYDKETVMSNLTALLEETTRSAGPEWIHLCNAAEISIQVDLLPASPCSEYPLYGVPIAVKDNIDVQGLPTTAACPTFEYVPSEDAELVKLFRKAGAIVLGKTNLDQFATGLVGTRSPYGIPHCVFSKNHVSGGSSSGSAVVVANGIVPLSLGTDTAGSGRVPAALNNIVGLKPTLGAWSTTGVVPACRSLDTASVFAQGLKDAQLAFNIGTAYDESNCFSRKFPERPIAKFPQRPVIGVPTALEFFGDVQNEKLFRAFVEKVASSGAEIRYIDCGDLFALAKLLYEGPWVAERTWAVRDHIEEHGESSLDPTVLSIVKGGNNIAAVDVFDKEYTRQSLKSKAHRLISSLDALLMPTCPLNPRIEDVLQNPISINSQQGYYTNFVNLADLAALAIPSGWRVDGLPVGATLLGPAFSDYALIELAGRFLSTGRRCANLDRVDESKDVLPATIRNVLPYALKLAVVGAHLSGMPLNWQLRHARATLLCRTRTAAKYRLFALDTNPPKPGIQEDDLNGREIEVEVYEIPYSTFGFFVSQIPAPLGIGKVELVSGETVSSFIWDGHGKVEREITEFGGWKNYVASAKVGKPFTKVLVANRGEIAVRIIKTLKRLEIKSVAVYSDSDKDAEHVKLADEAISLVGTTAAQTYLSIRKILDAAAQTGSEAIIPGYGFLSENADFADLCEALGFVFVGPSGEAMRSLGLKHSARNIAKRAGVPLVPGTQLLDTIEEALSRVEEIGGYPVMLKSTAGGGGIGLQRVDSDDELRRAFVTVKHQGEAYFGDSGVFLESFVENARHVEVQVFGDGFGHAVSLGVRDCSLQRRNQKVIEETPAPAMPAQTSLDLQRCGANLASSMNYRCAGTIEFIYDSARDKFYFLEVNARLQVEHPITEMATGIDLVEWMLLVASNRAPFDNETVISPSGCAMEARLYAENPAKDFRPSPGQITEIEFPSWARIDGWAHKGTVISSEFDPTIAKIIVKGKTREETLLKLQKALEETVVGGIITNRDYLLNVARSEMFAEAKMHTKILDSYVYRPSAVEILNPGPNTTIQDYPGRVKFWRIGVPPSGPMDAFSHRVANRLVGNPQDAAALEITLNGPTILFHCDRIVAITGGLCDVLVDGEKVALWRAIEVKSGAKLSVGKISSGCRAYVAIAGGLDVPKYLGSRSTFGQGKIGGYNGRPLKYGDLIPISPTSDYTSDSLAAFPQSLIPKLSRHWKVSVTLGPHGAPDFFDPSFIPTFFDQEWKVHYNSNRFGVRLTGPKPTWARADGGEGGLHPSNAHDYVYSPGAINFTGDEPVILGCDGPSLGGFVCLAVIVECELWKIGQMAPGDTIKFNEVQYDEARIMMRELDNIIENFSPIEPAIPMDMDKKALSQSGILFQKNDPKFVIRQAGDRYVLVEYGENVMDLSMRYRVHLLAEELKKVQSIVECSAGVRSLHVEFNPKLISQSSLIQLLVDIESSFSVESDWEIKSRVVHLPMAFEDSQTLKAVERYAETIRSEAPWLPNNVDFIANLNNVPRSQVRDLLFTASFMIMGLGDVYLGAPCAVPLDPRHRYLGSKYNPSRSWTPNGCVGLGGMYMCIYTMESPGGYQLCGRTVPIWDKLCLNQYTVNGEPWMLKPFDIVRFYPVSEADLDADVTKVEQGLFELRADESTFNFGKYKEFLAENQASIDEHNRNIAAQLSTFASVVAASDRDATSTSAEAPDLTQYSENAVFVYAEITGRFWKAVASEGDSVSPGDPLVVLEAMKTEMSVMAPDNASGKIVKIVHTNGDLVEAGDIVAVIE